MYRYYFKEAQLIEDSKDEQSGDGAVGAPPGPGALAAVLAALADAFAPIVAGVVAGVVI